MTNRQLAVRLILDALGLSEQCAMTTFDDRLVVQKAVYLLQAAGLPLGYFFSWYLRGPYCRSLASDMFESALDQLIPEAIHEHYELPPRVLQKLEPVRKLIENRTKGDLASWLELLASIHYLAHQSSIPANDERALQERLKAFNKEYSISDIKDAVSCLSEHRLLP